MVRRTNFGIRTDFQPAYVIPRDTQAGKDPKVGNEISFESFQMSEQICSCRSNLEIKEEEEEEDTLWRYVCDVCGMFLC